MVVLQVAGREAAPSVSGQGRDHPRGPPRLHARLHTLADTDKQGIAPAEEVSLRGLLLHPVSSGKMQLQVSEQSINRLRPLGI